KGNYVGLDIQDRQINKAREKALSMQISNADFYLSDARRTPISSGWADLSFCRLVLVHNPQPSHLIAEMVRTAKVQGKVLAIEPNNLSYIAYNKPYLNKCYHA
ncbi:class I SAM-dependent methyltransferase, partial [Piscirickettsia litoralis]|uniref:class I SAM-dependent methyltransferase n=1 Tax=Piscirickettsia litoralis TaxID=1891921 RepID=UPI001112FAD2